MNLWVARDEKQACTGARQAAIQIPRGHQFVRRFASILGVLVLLCSMVGARAQSSVVLGWNASPTATGYRIYQGTSSQAYTVSYDAGNATNFTVPGLTSGVTYYFAVIDHDALGLESSFSSEITATPGATNSRPPSTLTFAATSGTITGPFIAANGMIYQATQTALANGGQASFNFTVPISGKYVVSALVNAPNGAANSVYVNIDAQPTDPMMIWDLPITSGFTNALVSWEGLGPAPKQFTLAAGSHTLILRGREANTQIQSISILPAGPLLQLSVQGGVFVLNGLAQPGAVYEVQATQDFKTWTVISSATADSAGALALTDPAARGLAKRFYRLHQTSP